MHNSLSLSHLPSQRKTTSTAFATELEAHEPLRDDDSASSSKDQKPPEKAVMPKSAYTFYQLQVEGGIWSEVI